MSLRSIEEHLAAILATVHPTPVVEVPLADALGHTLAEPVRSRVDLPGFTNSATVCTKGGSASRISTARSVDR